MKNSRNFTIWIKIFAFLCLLVFSSHPAFCQEQFVFYVTDGTNNYFLSNPSGTTLSNSSTFDPSTCIFRGYEDDGDYYFLSANNNYLTHSNTVTDLNISLVTNSSDVADGCCWWTIGSYGLLHSMDYYYKSTGSTGNKYLYLRYDSQWNVNTKDNDAAVYGGSTNNWYLYTAVRRYLSMNAQLVEGNINSNIVATGTFNFAAMCTPPCNILQGYVSSTPVTDYYYGGSLHSTPPEPSSTVCDINYALSSNSYATIGSTTGVITVTSLPTAKDSITLTITASQGGVVVDTKVRTLYLYPAGAEIKETGIFGNKVILYDYEDHNWAYYAGWNDYAETTTANKYNTKYLGRIYSPDPRNVKITYRGGSVTGASDVAISREANEQQNEMVYYTTLEKYVIGEFTDSDNDGVPDSYENTAEQYPYTVIPNPFSKRPRLTSHSGTTDGFYGFAGWKIISGADYIQRASGKDAPVNNTTVLDLDEKIHFKDLPYGSVNCTSAEIIFEATWTPATVVEANTAQPFEGGTYETNFLVINSNTSSRITPTSPCTITGIYPDGSGTMKSINGVSAGVDNVKVEWVKSGTGNWNARGHNFTIGRGVTTTTIKNTESQFSGNNKNGTCANVVRVESGEYGRVFFHYEEGTAELTDDVNILAILGCDYDRAWAHPEDKNDTYTNKLILHRVDINGKSVYNFFRNAGQLYWRGVFKSGNHLGEFGDHLASSTNYTAGSEEQFYCAAHKRFGHRFLTVEGGRINGITGGSDNNEGDTEFQNGHRAFTLRIKGNACVLGCITGAASSNPGSGDRVFVITGGKIGGWVAAGANGDDEKGGTTIGNSYVYIGGNAQVNSRQFYTPHTLNHSFGGIVYGAGCGMYAGYKSGSMEESTNVVLADNAYVERALYGGGAYGQAANVSGNSTVNNVPANIYILGGHVGGVDGTNDTGEEVLKGGVFGGASLNHGCSSNIYMYGGLVEGGIYGGSNDSGNMNNDANIHILGGQIGTTSSDAHVHGGGLGNTTLVQGSINVTLGKTNATDSATIYGDVYGGSAMGKTNCDDEDTPTTDATTKVTLNKGLIYGSLYGGGLGNSTYEADVYGPITVTVNGGKVCSTTSGALGAVFGCNNANGRPQNNVLVNVTGGEMEYIYGGGNAASYTVPTPVSPATNYDVFHVSMSGGKVNKHVFGGGLGEAATITGSTEVRITGSSVIKGNVYGGGNAGKVTANTNVQIGEEAGVE